MRGTHPRETDRVWLSEEFSVEASGLCLDRPESPNSDHLCVRARGHAGRHEHRYGVRITTPQPPTREG